MGEPELKDHVGPEAENITLSSGNPRAEDETEEAASSGSVGRLPETADGNGTNVQRTTRSGRQSRMRQCPDFEYYRLIVFL